MSRSRTVLTLLGALVAAPALVVSLTGCAGGTSPEPSGSSAAASGACSGSTGVTVIVNYDLLDGGDIAACAPLESGSETVAAALKAAGVTTEGTAKYGDQVVCRVNDLPAADEPFTVPGHDEYTESCKEMAPEYAYWALWVKPAGGSWDYAAEGVGTQQVKPGDSVGLVFTTGGKTPTPK